MCLHCVHRILQSWLERQVTNICPLCIGHTASSSQKPEFGIPHHTWSGSRNRLWTWVIAKSDTDNLKRYGQWRLSPSCCPCKSQWPSTVFRGRPDRLKLTLEHPNTCSGNTHLLWWKHPLLGVNVGLTTWWTQEAVALFILPPLVISPWESKMNHDRFEIPQRNGYICYTWL